MDNVIEIIRDMDLAEAKIVTGELVDRGGYSNVFKGTLVQDDTTIEVALKSLRLPGPSFPEAVTHVENPEAIPHVEKRFLKEIIVWRQLQHPNVVRLLGYRLHSEEAIILVSMWYSNGNVNRYLKSYPNSNRHALVLDVINGLSYLHSIQVVHGDLKGENILVDADGHASLCDFGMSKFIDDNCHIEGLTTSSVKIEGTCRFMCPELLNGKPKSPATDMWAVGCLIVQILTDDKPYPHVSLSTAVYAAISRGELPSTNRNNVIGAAPWRCIKACWRSEPANRPKASEIGMCFTPPDTLVTPAELKALAFSSELKDEHFSDAGMKFSPDGQNLAVASADGTVSIWDAGRGVLRPLKTWGQKTTTTEPNYIFHIAWSASQQYLLVRSNRFLNIFVVETGESVLSENNKLWADFLPDGSAVAILERGGVISVKELAHIENILYTINLGMGSAFLGAIVLSPVSGQVIVATRSVLTVYEASSASRTTSSYLEECSESIRSISVSKDDRYILVSSKTLDPELWEIGVSEPDKVNKKLTCLRRYLSPKASNPGFQRVHFGGAGDELVLGLYKKQSIHIWDRDTAALIHSFCATPEKVTWDIALRWSLTDPEDIMLAVITSSLFHPEGGLQVWSINPPRETI